VAVAREVALFEANVLRQQAPPGGEGKQADVGRSRYEGAALDAAAGRVLGDLAAAPRQARRVTGTIGRVDVRRA
jgi:hypothetical protein